MCVLTICIYRVNELINEQASDVAGIKRPAFFSGPVCFCLRVCLYVRFLLSIDRATTFVMRLGGILFSEVDYAPPSSSSRTLFRADLTHVSLFASVLFPIFSGLLRRTGRATSVA